MFGRGRTINCLQVQGENGEVRVIRHGRNKVACNHGTRHSCMGGGGANGQNGELNGTPAIRLQQA
jgi:hypothetical protein